MILFEGALFFKRLTSSLLVTNGTVIVAALLSVNFATYGYYMHNVTCIATWYTQKIKKETIVVVVSMTG